MNCHAMRGMDARSMNVNCIEGIWRCTAEEDNMATRFLFDSEFNMFYQSISNGLDIIRMTPGSKETIFNQTYYIISKGNKIEECEARD